MSKYAIRDKVLIEGVIKRIDENANYPYQVLIADVHKIYFSEDEIKDASKTYEDGLADAWELARKIENKMSLVDLKYLFNSTKIADILDNFTPQEALAKIEAYEENKAIKVGDVVRFKDSKTEVLITSVKEELNGIHIQTDEYGKIGDVHSCICRKDVEKTGKHLDIEHLLEQIRGNE